MSAYEQKIAVRWSDVDQNRHVRHSAYYDYGAHVRIRFFADMGFGEADFERLSLGPIIFKESCSFIREIRSDEVVRVNILRGDMRPDWFPLDPPSRDI